MRALLHLIVILVTVACGRVPGPGDASPAAAPGVPWEGGSAEATVRLGSQAPGARLILRGSAAQLATARQELERHGMGHGLAWLRALSAHLASGGAVESQIAVLTLGRDDSVEEAERLLLALGLAEVRRDGVVLGSATPNDPQYSSQYALSKIGAPTAWDVTKGSASTIVAVIDSGIDTAHGDLTANLWKNSGETAGNGIDDDGNGFTDDVNGYDFVNEDANPMDDHRHGTHLAGIIGAVGNNALLTSGVAWTVRLMALKVLNSSLAGSTSNVIRGINYALAMQATVSNLSLGSTSVGSSMYDAVMLAARNADHVIVAAAGNAGSNNDKTPVYPASHGSANILSVCATDSADAMPAFSNFGATSVDLCAPGVSVLSTRLSSTTQTQTGTSQAAAHVTGVVALLRSLSPEATYLQVTRRILSSSAAVAGLSGKSVTGARLSASGALSAGAFGPVPKSMSPSGATVLPPGAIEVTFSMDIDPATFTTAAVTSFTGPGGADLKPAITSMTVQGKRGRIEFPTQTAGGTYTLVLASTVKGTNGVALDGDEDGVAGEAADGFSGTFTLGYRVAIAVSGPGTVASSPAGIACGVLCAAHFPAGTSLTLTATPAVAAALSAWGGACSGAATTCNFTLNSDVTVSASFVTNGTLLVARKSGTGAGSVTSSPPGIDCGASCASGFASGSAVTLTATPASHSSFAGWTGCPAPSGNTCTIASLTDFTTVHAQFDPLPAQTLTVSRTGAGTGRVRWAGVIDCGTTCSASVTPGTTLTLQAEPSAGSSFAGWTNCPSVSGASCTLTMGSAMTVTAAFSAASPFTLTVSRSGAGTGTVRDVSGAIDCGSSCASSYPAGTAVSLRAVASVGSVFGGWSGCHGTAGDTCFVQPGGDTTITATFLADPASFYDLSITRTGSSTGTVTSDVGGIACGASCTRSIGRNTTVTLSADAPVGATFGGWAGCDGESAGQCSVSMSHARTVVAYFVRTASLLFQDALDTQAVFAAGWQATGGGAPTELAVQSGALGIVPAGPDYSSALVLGLSRESADVTFRYDLAPTASVTAKAEAVVAESGGTSYRGGVECDNRGSCTAYLGNYAAGALTVLPGATVTLPSSFPSSGVLRLIAKGTTLTLTLNGRLALHRDLGATLPSGSVGLALSKTARARRFFVNAP